MFREGKLHLNTIIATCRNPDEAADLLRLRDEHADTVVVKQLDITRYEKNFKDFVQDIKVGTANETFRVTS